MATIADTILIKLGVDPQELISGLQNAMNTVKNNAQGLNKVSQSATNAAVAGQKATAAAIAGTNQRVGEAISAAKAGSAAFDAMAVKWKGAVLGLLRTIAAPIAGALAFGSTIKTYFSGVAQVAQMTGAYSTKMEEWRKKRALLARVNREDIELYIKGREALLKFQLTMADFSTFIMRALGPAIKWLIERLNKFSDWVDRNQPNILRFLSILGVVLTAVLIPAFKRLAVAMLMNPLTWYVAGILAIVAVIDDLVTYLRGGDSLFGAFWGPAIEWCKIAYDWMLRFWESTKNSVAFKALMAIATNLFEHIGNGISGLINFFGQLFDKISLGSEDFTTLERFAIGTFDAIKGAFQIVVSVITGLIGLIVAVFTGDTAILSHSWEVFCEGVKNLFRGVKNTVISIIDSIVGVFNGMIGLVKKGLNKLMPDWLSKKLGLSVEADGVPATPEQTGVDANDVPIIPDATRDLRAGNAAKAAAQNISNRSVSTTVNNNVNVNTNSQAVVDRLVDDIANVARFNADASASQEAVK